jgi:hypothetical protein
MSRAPHNPYLDLVGISLSTSVTFVAGATPSEQQAAISSATSTVQDYINNLAVGQELVINDIADKILNADSNILDIGNPESTTG